MSYHTFKIYKRPSIIDCIALASNEDSVKKLIAVANDKLKGASAATKRRWDLAAAMRVGILRTKIRCPYCANEVHHLTGEVCICCGGHCTITYAEKIAYDLEILRTKEAVRIEREKDDATRNRPATATALPVLRSEAGIKQNRMRKLVNLAHVKMLVLWRKIHRDSQH